MITLDTDVISELLRPRPADRLVARLRALPVQDQSTTAITLGELAYGAHRAGRPELYERALGLLAGTVILPFDHAAATQYGRIRAELEREGRRLADPDLRIAATALARHVTLVTGNVRHFARVPGLEVEDWIRGQTA